MSLINKLKENENNVEVSSSKLIKNEFLNNAETYWGDVTNVKVHEHRGTDRGTIYYLVMAKSKKNGKEGIVLQEWYIAKDGSAKINPKRVMWIDAELGVEIGSDMMEV